MSGVTITAGVSFSGGITMTEAPLPPENTAAWFGGGYWHYDPGGRVSRVDRITFATDTATASVRGPLSVARSNSAVAGNLTDGWFGGGKLGVPSYADRSTVQRITYATDTATASVRGPLSLARRSLAAAGNTTDGWFGGGTPGDSTVDRITYATDTATASVRGPLSSTRYVLAAAGNTDYAWFGGGFNEGARSTVQRITYATDTATASVRGPLSLARFQLAAAGNTTDGWFGGGNPPDRSTVDRITYATDTATASVRGPLSLARPSLAAVGNSTDGWFGGGYNSSAQPYNKSTVDRITYATDTATASVRGTLSYPAGTSVSAAAGNETDGWFGGGNAGGVPGLSAVERITYATDTATASIRGPLSLGRCTNRSR